MIYDIIIIGGGASGMTAALYSCRSNKKVLILESSNIGGQIAFSPKVENFPAIKEISGSEFADNLFEQATSYGAEFEFEEVTSLNKTDDLFYVKTNYHEYLAKSVIIATGVKHRQFGYEHEERLIGHGISYCAICDGAFYKNETVALIGDGNTALQYALLLSSLCQKVYVCTLFNQFFGDEILVKQLRQKENVEIIHNLSLQAFNGDEKLESLTFTDTINQNSINLKVKAVFIAIGQIPNNEVFTNLVDLDSEGYIITNEDCCTRTKGLYASGDCRNKKVRQLTTAVSDGAISAIQAIAYLDTLKD